MYFSFLTEHTCIFPQKKTICSIMKYTSVCVSTAITQVEEIDGYGIYFLLDAFTWQILRG